MSEAAMPFDVFAARSMAAFAADGQFVEGGVCVTVRELSGRSRATGMAADAVIGDSASKATGIIGFVARSDIPAGLCGEPVQR